MRDDIDPNRCSKRDIADVFGFKLKEVDKLVREGMPCEPSGKGPRAPLVFNSPKVWRWLFVRDAYQRGELCGLLAEETVRTWDLEYEIAVLKGEIDPAHDFRKA